MKTKIKEKFGIVGTAWGMTFTTLRSNPRILIPFFVVGLVDAIILTVLYLAPRPPLSAVLAPPIRAFWGEQFLHYPMNFLLLPNLFKYVHLIATASIGVLMSGLAIGLIQQTNAGHRPLLSQNLINSFKRYLALVSIWAFVFAIVWVIFKVPQVVILKSRFSELKGVVQSVFYTSLFISIFVEAVFIYAMPAAIVENRGAYRAIQRAVSVSRSIFLPTFLLVMIPTLFYLPVMIAKGKLPALMMRFSPDIVLVVLGVGIILSMGVNCIVTSSATVLFLLKKDTEVV